MNNLKINLITIIILIIGIAASVLFYNLAFFVIASIPAIAYKYGMSGYYRNKNKYYKVEETTKVNIYNSNETISPIEISKDSSYLFGSGFEREEGSRANDYKDEHFKSAKEKK